MATQMAIGRGAVSGAEIMGKRGGALTAKLVVPQNNANHPLAAQLPKNADMRVKVFVYDFLKDKI
jgi:hypothetical protein